MVHQLKKMLCKIWQVLKTNVINFSFTMGGGRQRYGKTVNYKKYELLLTWKNFFQKNDCFNLLDISLVEDAI